MNPNHWESGEHFDTLMNAPCWCSPAPTRWSTFTTFLLELFPCGANIYTLPSLLGRDVIDRWRMVYDPQTPLLEFSIRSADLTMSAEELGRYGSP